MTSLKEIIEKEKQKNTVPSVFDLAQFIYETANDIITQKFAELEKSIQGKLSEVMEMLSREAKEKISSAIYKGEKGEKGDTVIGPPGPIGPMGSKPKAGIDYPIPKNGKDGLRGEQGLQGIPGKDGSPDTPLQIAEKLNMTKESININVIKGLEERFSSSIRTIKEKTVGGGGMGNIQHEIFNVSASTTTITTAYPIAGGGFAIFGAFYQGQQIHRGTHYTVGSNRRTIAIVAAALALENNTQITIVYMRG